MSITERYNGQAVLSHWIAGPRVSSTNYKTYVKLSSTFYSRKWARW